MFYRYIGEELIWKVMGNNPYELNKAAGIDLYFRADSQNDAIKIRDFFLSKLDHKDLLDVSYDVYSIKLKIKNVFGNISTVNISLI